MWSVTHAVWMEGGTLLTSDRDTEAAHELSVIEESMCIWEVTR